MLQLLLLLLHSLLVQLLLISLQQLVLVSRSDA